MLTARLLAIGPSCGRAFDFGAEVGRAVGDGTAEHLLIERGGASIRIDVIEGTAGAGPAEIHFDLVDDEHLESRIAAIRAFFAPTRQPRQHYRLSHRLLCLAAVDARDARLSLRETAQLILGPGDWPGDGEHRKSKARRMIAAGDKMVRAGPRAILNQRGSRSRRLWL